MIDFPTLYPNLVKYLPNWMERFYPRMAQFARGEGYPCGNKGVFIPRRNNCWTHPKTGNRLTKPLTYQKYQEAKEKSQKSRTEAGRTALQSREQGFRDKAREKVKGWQNNKQSPTKLASTWDGLDEKYKIELLTESGLKVKALERKKYREGSLDDTLSLIQDPKVKKSLTKALENPKYQEEFYSKNRPPTEKTPAKTTLEFLGERYKDVDDGYIEKQIKDLRKRSDKLSLQGMDQVNGMGKRSTRKAVASHSAWKFNNEADDLEELLLERKKAKARSSQNPETEPKSTPDSDVSKRAIADIERIKSGQHVINKRDGYSLAYRGRGVYDLNDLDVPKGWRAKPTKLTEKEATDFLAEKYKSMNLSTTKPEPKPTPDSKGVKGAGLGSSIKQRKSEEFLSDAEQLENYLKKRTKKNNFNSNLKLAQFGGNNLRILKSKLANFASYPCGNKGVFISSSKNCYTHPKTGNKLDKPLKFKDYTQARKEAFQKSKAGGELTETEQQLVLDVNRLQGKVSDKRRAKELNSAAKRMGAKAILPSGIAEADPNKIKVDPKRFQYKIIGEQTKSGEVGSLSGVKKWDANLGGILQVWRDPRNGDVNVVNGHNRLALAKKLNAPSVTVKLIDAKTPQEARAIGALTNIAEGRGNAQDAAKFFRDSGVTKQELEKKGVPMREKIAEDGLALSNLSNSLFNRVVQGQIPEQRAVVIGAKIKDHRQQQDLLELVEKEEKRGKKITNDTIEELSDMVTNAPSKTESQGGLFDLLGFSPESRSLAVEKAQIQSAIKRQLSGDKRLFSTVGKSKAAQNLEKAGNKINVEESNEIADTAGKALSAFDQEKMLTGKVSDYLNQAAERLAGNQKGRDKIIKETYEQVLDELQKTYRFGKGAGSKGTEGLSAIDREEKAIQDEKRKQFEKAKKAGQIDLFAASANLKLANFAKTGCCCEASKPLKRRKTKQTPRLKRRGNRYA